MAGLDILTDGDARFDNDVGGRSWFFYPLERLGGFTAYNDGIDAWRSFTRPGEILWEVMESYRPRTLSEKVSRGPLQYAAVWKVGQRLTTKPLKFGAIAVDSVTHMMVNEAYEDERELVFDFADIFNQEYRELAAAGCPIIQIEEPLHHILSQSESADLDLMTETFNRQVDGVDTEIWCHTCWGNPAQQTTKGNLTYEPALEAMFEMNADVITFECASSDGEDLEAIGKIRSDKKVGIGVISHLRTPVESPEAGSGPHPESNEIHTGREVSNHDGLRLWPGGIVSTDLSVQDGGARPRHEYRQERVGSAGGRGKGCGPKVRIREAALGARRRVATRICDGRHNSTRFSRRDSQV